MLISLPTAKGGKTFNESGVVDNTKGPFHNKENFENVHFLEKF